MSRCGCPQAADPPTACRNQFAGVGRLPATHPYFNHVRVYSTSIPPEDGRPHALRARTHLQALHASGRRCEAWCEAAYAACCTRMDEWMIAAGAGRTRSATEIRVEGWSCLTALPPPPLPPSRQQLASRTHTKIHMSRFCISVIGFLGTASAAPAGDRVTSIPGFVNFPKFPVYSGCACRTP